MNTLLWIAVGVVWIIIIPTAIVNLRMRRALAKEKKQREVEEDNKSPDWKHLPIRTFKFYLKWTDGSVNCVFKVKTELEHDAIETFKEACFDKVQTVLEALEDEGREPILDAYIQIDDGPMEECVIAPVDQERLEMQVQIDELSRDLSDSEEEIRKSQEFDLQLMILIQDTLSLLRGHLEDVIVHTGLTEDDIKPKVPSE